MKVLFVPLDVSRLSNAELGRMLQDIGDGFPYGGDNYNQPVLLEALRRLNELEESHQNWAEQCKT